MEVIKLDLIPSGRMPSLHASQYDDGRDYHIDLTENRAPYTLDGTETISLTVRKCDNTLVTMDVANTFADKSYIEFRTTEQMNACAGFNYGEITIEKNGTQISSLNFYLQVEGAPDEGGITSQSEINNLKRQVHDAVVEELEENGAEETGYDNTESGLEATNVQDAIDEVNTKIENIPSVDAYTKQESDSFLADEYDATQTYNVGDYRIHEGGLYVCNTAISTAEAWDASHWTLIDVGSALQTKANATATAEALAEKANKSTVEDLENEVEAIKDGIDEYVYTLVPYDRQLFDWKTMTPATPIRKMFNSSNLIVENTSCRLYFIEVEGKADEYYSFNIINPDNFHANALYMFASNSLDVGASVKAGSTNIDNKRGYVKLDGTYRYICFAISSTLGNQEAITTECNDIVKKLVIRRSIGSVGYDTTYYPYEVYPIYKVDVPNDFEYRHSKTLLCGDNLLLNDASTVGAGWSGSLASGYTHSSGSNELVFSGLPLTSGKKYVVIFDATGDLESWLFVKLGASVFVDVYNGITSFAIGFVSDGTGTLTFKPTNQFAGTVSNIEVREVDAGSNEIVLPKYENIDRGLAENVTGFWNTSISPDGLQKNINGTRNVAIGLDALRDIKTGNRNIGIGTFALNKITSGDRNVAIGSDAAYMTTKTEDTVAIGYAALINGGDRCVAIGTMAANGSNGSAQNVVAIGHEAAWYAGSHTVAIGYQAGYYTKGTGNVSIGKSAGNTLYVTGDRNVCIGREAAFDGTGSTSANPKTISNSIAIGNEAKITKSNQAVIGSSAITEVVFCGNKKINFNQDGTVTWEILT